MDSTNPTRPSKPPPNAYEGPDDNDPLTEKELEILLAIPRAAENTPNDTAFRIPLGADPSTGWIDVTWSEARSIIARLAATWSTRLSEILIDQGGLLVGPGTTISILVQPSVQTLFHIFAFRALGCTLQFISLSLNDETIDLYLNATGCRLAFYSGISEAWVNARRNTSSTVMVPLPEDEYAHRLAQREKQEASQTFPWPEPRRPTPAVILHTSATTGVGKLYRFSLYYYTLGLPTTTKRVRTSATQMSYPTIKTPYTHPFLVLSPPYWQSFHALIISHSVAGTPIAFAHIPDILKFPGSQLIDWVRSLDVGGMLCIPRFFRESSMFELEDSISVLQSLYIIIVCGLTLDASISALAEKYKLKLMNAYGCTEVPRILSTTQAPYTHLLASTATPPLVMPIPHPQSGGSRQVQLWHSLSTSPQLAHLYARGGVPLKLEPFPGSGPHQGELALNLGDVFEQVTLPPGSSEEFAYVHIGRSDDFIRLCDASTCNAAPYESRIRFMVDSFQAGWVADAVQLFGTDLPFTVLVIQLSKFGETQAEHSKFLEHDLRSLVESANKEFKLGPRIRVHTQKRLLVITPEGAHGPHSEYIRESGIRLSTTHKHSLQRWKNIQAFRVWLDMLDFSEP